MKNTGKDYELFVRKLQQAILDTELFTIQTTINVELDKKIIDNCGINRQFDIYWEYELGGIVYKTVIECKDYNSRISVEKIDAFIGKTRDIPDLRLVFATKQGYQSGAKLKAEQNKVDLLIFREQKESDWEDEDGNPLLKKLCLNITGNLPAEIHSFKPFVSRDWLEKNINLDLSKPLQIASMNDNIIIEDIIKNEKYSIRDLASMLAPLGSRDYGTFSKNVDFDEAYITCNDLRLKLDKYEIEYTIPQPIKTTTEIDFSKELIGVVEYLKKGSKKAIFTNGMVKESFDKRIE